MATFPASVDKIKENWLTLSFPKDLETEFRNDYFQKSLAHVRMATLVAIFFYGFFGILDAYLVPEVKTTLWIVRYGVFFPFAFGIFLFTFSKKFKYFMQLAVAAVVLVAGLGIVAMIVMAPHRANDSYYAGLILVSIFGYTFFKLRFIWATVVGWITVIAYEVAAMWYAHTPILTLVNNNFFFIAGNMIGMFACYSIEFYSRKEFIQTHLLEAEKRKANAANRELEKRVEERTRQLSVANEELKQEIQERKRAEDEVRQYNENLELMVQERTEDLKISEEKYRNILENITDGYYEVDLSGNLTFFNDSLRKLAGYTRAELMGMSNKDYTDPEYAQKLYREYNKVFLTKVPTERVDWEIKRKDGSKGLVESSVSLVMDPNGEAIGFRGIVRDVTDRKVLENELMEKTRLAEEASKAKSEFLANMSHEIRTPLNGIIGMTELAMDSPLTDEQKNIFHAINTEANILFGLINDILDFSKIEAGKIELEEVPFDLRAVVEDVAGSIALSAEQKGLEFMSFLAPEIPPLVIGDPGRLRQILTNLAGNALKFTHEGEIYIKAEVEEDAGGAITIRFQVKDTGIGIPKEKQAKIFESFTQQDGSTTRKYGGTGLGTTISKQLVELMGGEIGVQSEEGEGSTFWFTAVLSGYTGQDVSPKNSDIDLRNMKVLVVDDNETNRFIQMEYLRAWGCRPVEAPGGGKALAILEGSVSQNDPFDMVLTDIQMPEMNGFDLSTEIRKRRELKKIPIIAFASSGGATEYEKCKDAGIDGYLIKPIRRDRMLKVITSVLGLSSRESASLVLVTKETETQVKAEGTRVLLAEDYPTNQQVAMKHLQSAGYHVDLVENGLQALEAYQKKHYDLILMDIQMPVMEGYEATRAIRKLESEKGGPEETSGSEASARIPIIAMTAHALTGVREKCMEAGMDDYLAKPLRRKQLVAMVNKWVSDRSSPREQTQTNESRKTIEDADAPMNFDKALEEFEEDRDFLLEVLAGFVEKVKSQIDTIQSALDTGDPEVVWKEAHSIKGGAANLTAEKLSSIAFELEKAGKSGELGGAGEILGMLEKEYRRLGDFARNVN